MLRLGVGIITKTWLVTVVCLLSECSPFFLLFMSDNHEIDRLKLLLEEKDEELASLRKQMSDSPMATAMQMSGLAWWSWDVRRGVVQIHGLPGVFPNSPNGDFEISSGEWGSLIDPMDIDDFRKSLKDFDRNRANVWTHECRVLKMEGASCWMTFRGYVCEERADGSRAHMVGTIQDVDERKKDEIQLNLQKEYLIAGSRLASLGAWIYYPDARKVEWSEGVFKIHGLPVGEVPSLAKCLSYYVKKDQPRIMQALEHLEETGEGYDLECEITAEDGIRKFVRVIGRRYDNRLSEGQSLVGVIQDITDQSTMRRGMDAFFKLTPDLVGAIDFKLRPVTISPSWESLLGWSRYDMIRHGVECVVHEKDRPLMEKALQRAMVSHAVEWVETRVVSKRGDEYWLSWRMFADCSLKLIFISARDITESRMVRDALLEAKEMADSAERAKANFLATMSHELRTPLNPILGFSDLLLEELEDEEHLEMLRVINESGQKLTSVLNGILDYTKIDSGTVSLAEDHFSMSSLLEELLLRAKSKLASDRVDLKLVQDIDPRIPAGVECIGDQYRIMSVVAHLLDNAVKFSDSGEVVLHSSLVQSGDSGVLWHVDVSDQGIGIPSRILDSIFDPFLLGDDTYTRRYEGTGMGLAICKRSVELMGGQISVKSEPSVGSTFSVMLPLRISKVEVENVVHVDDFSVLESMQLKVFMVEDNLPNIYYQMRILKEIGCRVTSASSGEIAFAKYETNQYDLILLDLHMSGVGGLDVLKWIRSKEIREGAKRVPILIVSADVMPSAKAVCLEYGADGFISKPVSPDGLKSAILNFVSLDR